MDHRVNVNTRRTNKYEKSGWKHLEELHSRAQKKKGELFWSLLAKEANLSILQREYEGRIYSPLLAILQ